MPHFGAHRYVKRKRRTQEEEEEEKTTTMTKEDRTAFESRCNDFCTASPFSRVAVWTIRVSSEVEFTYFSSSPLLVSLLPPVSSPRAVIYVFVRA